MARPRRQFGTASGGRTGHAAPRCPLLAYAGGVALTRKTRSPRRTAITAPRPKPGGAGKRQRPLAAAKGSAATAKGRPRATTATGRGAATAKAPQAALAGKGEGAAPLTKEERLRLAEAVRLGEEARREAEDALTGYGRWLLVNVFGDDTSEALENKRRNAVWHALIALAGGPKLRLSRTSIHLAVQLAAYDKRLGDEAFRGLDVTRKRLLVPLRDDGRIREAAQHVASMKLTAVATAEYVRALMEDGGETPAPRMTPAGAGARVARAARPFKDRSVLGKWKSQLAELTGEARQGALAELRSITKAVQELLAALGA